MKKLLLSATAFISLTSGAIAAPFFGAAPFFTWTGLYVGVQGGYARGEDRTKITVGGITFPDPKLGKFDTDGFFVGAHAGANVQLGSIVVGVEGDIENASIKGSRTLADPVHLPGYSASIGSEINFQGSARGRLGFGFDRLLIYATGGLAFTKDFENRYSATLTASNPFNVSAGTHSESFERTQWGWTAGGGVEVALTNNLTTRAEYRYTQFDSIRNTSSSLSPANVTEQEPSFHSVRAGISLRY